MDKEDVGEANEHEARVAKNQDEDERKTWTSEKKFSVTDFILQLNENSNK